MRELYFKVNAVVCFFEIDSLKVQNEFYGLLEFPLFAEGAHIRNCFCKIFLIHY